MSEGRRLAGHHGAFGEDTFGRFAEKTARFFGTPQYIIGQTIVVGFWIAFNVLAFTKGAHFDARPFILLNLIFSTQAAYAAPLILLAQTRQADRDKIEGEKSERRHTRLENGVKSETDNSPSARSARIRSRVSSAAALRMSSVSSRVGGFVSVMPVQSHI